MQKGKRIETTVSQETGGEGKRAMESERRRTSGGERTGRRQRGEPERNKKKTTLWEVAMKAKRAMREGQATRNAKRAAIACSPYGKEREDAERLTLRAPRS